MGTHPSRRRPDVRPRRPKHADGVGTQVRRRRAALLLVPLVGGLLAYSIAKAGTSASPPAVRRARAVPSTPPGAPATAIAQARGAQVVVYQQPGGPSSSLRLANPNAEGAPLVFDVRERQNGWLRVALPIRPNASTGWIRTADVTLTQTSARVEVNLTRHLIRAWNAGTLVVSAPIGVGKSLTPTPDGTYYITELLQPPDPTGPYGPYAFGLSAFSTVLTSFAGGNGQIGIHGTNDPKGLGSNVSHGCIRVANDTIRRLAGVLPLGTPVTITRSA